jgi:hypothetical protein
MFDVRLGGDYEGERSEPPDYGPLIIGWIAFFCMGLVGISVGFIDAWPVAAFVVVSPVVAVVWLCKMQGRL